MSAKEKISEIEELILRRKWVIEQLKVFEEKYKMKTEEFLDSWEKGLLPEPEEPNIHGDFIVWHGLAKEYNRINKILSGMIKT